MKEERRELVLLIEAARVEVLSPSRVETQVWPVVVRAVAVLVQVIPMVRVGSD